MIIILILNFDIYIHELWFTIKYEEINFSVKDTDKNFFVYTDRMSLGDIISKILILNLIYIYMNYDLQLNMKK